MRVWSLVVVATVLTLAAASSAMAEKKQSGTLQCAKPDPVQTVQIGDMPNHAMVVSQLKCTWSKGLEMEGSQTKEGTSTDTSEMNGSTSSGTGYHWGTMASGDKYYVRYDAKATYTKDGALQGNSGKWHYTGGTGKLKGLEGKGIYKCKGNADGSSTCDIEGEYKISER